MSRIVDHLTDGRPVVELTAPDMNELHGLYVIWPGFRGEKVYAKLERQYIETENAAYFMYTPRLSEPKRRGLMRFAR